MDRKDLPVDNNLFSSSRSLAKRDMRSLIYEFSWQKELAKYQILPDVHSLTLSFFQHGNGSEFDPSINPMLEKITCECQLSTCTEHAQVGFFGHPGLGTGSSRY